MRYVRSESMKGSMKQRVRMSEEALAEEGACGLRCACGSLLAKRVPEGVQLKCRRCKAMTVVPLEE